MRELLWALHQYFFSPLLWLLAVALLVYVVLSWLLVMGVVDRRNPVPMQIYNFLGATFEPLLRPIRRIRFSSAAQLLWQRSAGSSFTVAFRSP